MITTWLRDIPGNCNECKLLFINNFSLNFHFFLLTLFFKERLRTGPMKKAAEEQTQSITTVPWCALVFSLGVTLWSFSLKDAADAKSLHGLIKQVGKDLQYPSRSIQQYHGWLGRMGDFLQEGSWLTCSALLEAHYGVRWVFQLAQE